jgi:DNA topoisomerase-1
VNNPGWNPGGRTITVPARGLPIKAADFRTWAGTVLAARAFRDCPAGAGQAEARRQVVAVIADIARRLGNTPAVCRKCYVHPGGIAAYLDGSLGRARDEDLAAEEEALLAFLADGK